MCLSFYPRFRVSKHSVLRVAAGAVPCHLFYRGARRRSSPIFSSTSSYMCCVVLGWVGESRALCAPGLALTPISMRFSIELPVDVSGRRDRTLAARRTLEAACGWSSDSNGGQVQVQVQVQG